MRGSGHGLGERVGPRQVVYWNGKGNVLYADSTWPESLYHDQNRYHQRIGVVAENVLPDVFGGAEATTAGQFKCVLV